MNPTKRNVFIAYRKQLLTVVMVWVGCFIVFLFAYLLVLAPQNKIKKEVENELTKAKQEYQFALRATQEENRIQLKKKISKLQDKMHNHIIDFEDLANLTFDISRIASKRRISSFSIKNKHSGVSEIPECKYIGENELNINFISSFEQFTGFLSSLERHRPVVFVKEFSLSCSPLDKKRANLSVNMNVAVFVRKQQGS